MCPCIGVHKRTLLMSFILTSPAVPSISGSSYWDGLCMLFLFTLGKYVILKMYQCIQWLFVIVYEDLICKLRKEHFSRTQIFSFPSANLTFWSNPTQFSLSLSLSLSLSQTYAHNVFQTPSLLCLFTSSFVLILSLSLSLHSHSLSLKHIHIMFFKHPLYFAYLPLPLF